MLEFRKIEVEDIDIFKKYISSENEFSCETSFVNLLIWQGVYGNKVAIEDGQLIVMAENVESRTFRLPFGDNFDCGLELIREYCGQQNPTFWVQDGMQLEEFKKSFNGNYTLTESRDAFDYIYSREALATLSGKKYHSKRNHISAFTKSFNWCYKPITNENIADIKICAEKWYSENQERYDKYLECEKQGIYTILENMERLSVKGGAIYVDNSVVAFTLGSPINSNVFDIHIEKALSDFSTAYTVINNEFAKRELSEYKYINREDDMGQEGLRKAKLSYKPEILLKKYCCRLGDI